MSVKRQDEIKRDSKWYLEIESQPIEEITIYHFCNRPDLLSNETRKMIENVVDIYNDKTLNKPINTSKFDKYRDKEYTKEEIQLLHNQLTNSKKSYPLGLRKIIKSLLKKDFKTVILFNKVTIDYIFYTNIALLEYMSGEKMNPIVYNNPSVNSVGGFKTIYADGLFEILDNFEEITKDDIDIDISLLSEEDKKVAIRNSIVKLVEEYKNQPQHMKKLLLDLSTTKANDFIEALEFRLSIDDYSDILEVFQRHKVDTKGRVYNHNFFKVLYYTYGIDVSIKYLINTYGDDRKINKKTLEIVYKAFCNVWQSDNDEYKEFNTRVANFIKEVEPQQLSKYIVNEIFECGTSFYKAKEMFKILNENKGVSKGIKESDLPSIEHLLTPFDEWRKQTKAEPYTINA
jgi:hypothetical protein